MQTLRLWPLRDASSLEPHAPPVQSLPDPPEAAGASARDTLVLEFGV